MSMSTTKAEYVALGYASRVGVWVRRFLNEMGLSWSWTKAKGGARSRAGGVQYWVTTRAERRAGSINTGRRTTAEQPHRLDQYKTRPAERPSERPATVLWSDRNVGYSVLAPSSTRASMERPYWSSDPVEQSVLGATTRSDSQGQESKSMEQRCWWSDCIGIKT